MERDDFKGESFYGMVDRFLSDAPSQNQTSQLATLMDNSILIPLSFSPLK